MSHDSAYLRVLEPETETRRLAGIIRRCSPIVASFQLFTRY